MPPKKYSCIFYHKSENNTIKDNNLTIFNYVTNFLQNKHDYSVRKNHFSLILKWFLVICSIKYIIHRTADDKNATSGVKEITLYADGVEIETKDVVDNKATFTIPVEDIADNTLHFNKTISATATDNVGNTTEVEVLPDTNNSNVEDSKLMIETIKPTIEVSCEDAADEKNTATADANDWYNNDVESTVDVADENAGIRNTYAKYNGGTDVYLVVANSQLDEVAKKKANLLDELIAAFDAEGIKVTINKETGEMLLDSSVLFGGDSAVLTDEGKTFLNKFIKVYTTVAFSDKYSGFISKTMIEGHTAPISGSTYEGSLPLSQERADNVKNYCLSAETGVNVSDIANTLEAVGYSNSQPVYAADGSVDLDASRRVSFRFLVNIDI